MSTKHREITLNGDRVVGVKDAPKRWRLVERADSYAVADGDGNVGDVGYVALSIEDEAGRVIVSDDYGIAREHMVLMAAAPELLNELKLAHGIIANALNLMPKEQKLAWDEANERDGLKDAMAMTRHDARKAVIANADVRTTPRCGPVAP